MRLTHQQIIQEAREIDPERDGQRRRPPKSRIGFEQHPLAVAEVISKFEHTYPSQVCALTNLLACTMKFFIDGFAHTIGTGPAPALTESTVLEGMKYDAVLRENRNSNACTFEKCLNEVA